MLSRLLPLLCSVAPLVRAYYNDSTAYTSGDLGAFPIQSYHSSNATPPVFNFNVYPSSAPPPGSLFLAPRGQPVPQPGPIVVDAFGELIWDGAVYGQTLECTMQTYLGQPVIGLWVGAFNAGGWGNGYELLLDQTYTMVANMTTTIPNNQVDFHELQVTGNNTVLFGVFDDEQYDLSSYNVTTTDGSKGWIIENYAQEIDIATGQALFTWNSLDHVNPNSCYAAPGTTGSSKDSPWDYFHLNSIDKDAAGNFLISSRHCHAVYYVSGTNGTILWTLGGMNSSFTMGNGTNFEWQHDVRWVNSNETQISIFDNAGTSFATSESESRALILDINMANMSVTLAQEYLPWNATISQSQGSARQQPNGNMLVGWGQNPFFSEYDLAGNLLWSAQFGLDSNTQGYRVLRGNWTGYPTTNPNVSVITNTSTSAYDVYVSWNGATEVSTYNLLGSTDTTGTSTPLLNVTKTGFETLLSVSQSNASTYTYLQVQAMMSNGSTLGYSDFMTLNGTSAGTPTTSQVASVTVGKQTFMNSTTSTMNTTSATNMSSTATPVASPTDIVSTSKNGSGRNVRQAGWAAVMLGVSALMGTVLLG